MSFRNLKTKHKLTLLIGLILLFNIAVGSIGLLNLGKINQGVDSLYNNRVVPLQQLKNISDVYAVSIVDIAHKVNHYLITYQQAEKELKEATVVVSNNWNTYEKNVTNPEERKLMTEAIELRKCSKATYFNLVKIIQQGDNAKSREQLVTLIESQLYQTIDPYTEKISELISTQLNIAEDIKHHSERTLGDTTKQTVVIIFIAIILSIVISYITIKVIMTQLGGEPIEVEEIARKVANGDLNIKLSNKPIGAMKWLGIMTSNLIDIVSKISQGADHIVNKVKR